MRVNEYIPGGSWMKYYRRKQLLETARTWAYIFVLLFVFVVAGSLDSWL